MSDTSRPARRPARQPERRFGSLIFLVAVSLLLPRSRPALRDPAACPPAPAAAS